MIALLLLLVTADRIYHKVPLAKVAASQRTHIETCGYVAYVRYMKPKSPECPSCRGDGDWHVTLILGSAKIGLEIIPAIPLTIPKKGQWIRARGIKRFDEWHNLHEIHPVEGWEPVERC